MALSSWNALYTYVEQKFMKKRQWRYLHLLKVFVQHADPFGMSYPGPDRIKDLTGIGTERQINATLEWLVDGEYIRVHEEWNRWKRANDRIYQVSPLKMYIREELQSYCEKVWLTGDRDFDFEVDVIKRNGQPTSEPESESSTDNHHQNHHHHPANNDAPKEQGQKRVRPRDYVKQREQRENNADWPTEKDPQAGGPPPPDKPDLRKYRSPLLGVQEDHAQDIKTMIGVRINQARALVANYPIDVIDVAKRAVLNAMERGAAKDPPALFTHLVKKAAVSPSDKTLYPTRAEQMAAENDRLTYQDNDDQTQGDENNAKL
jgi:hypothetical protein